MSRFYIEGIEVEVSDPIFYFLTDEIDEKEKILIKYNQYLLDYKNDNMCPLAQKK